jgi:hypothetical protein
VKIIDVSLVTDSEQLGGKLFNHRYFYLSPTIREDIHNILIGKPNWENKKPLEDSVIFLLKPSK